MLWPIYLDYAAIKTSQEILAQLAQFAAQNKSSACERFIESAKKYPNNVALIFEGQQFTWKQLDELSNQFANWLRGQGVKANDMVALCFENSVEMYVAFLGTMKAG